MAEWKMPSWLRQYEKFVCDTDRPVEQMMADYAVSAADLIQTPAGKLVSVNGQVGLLVILRAQGLLKDVPPLRGDSEEGKA